MDAVAPDDHVPSRRRQCPAGAASAEIGDGSVVVLACPRAQRAEHQPLGPDTLAESVEEAICRSVPEVDAVHTHLEPLAEAGPASLGGSAELEQAVRAASLDELGTEPKGVRFLETHGGLVLFLTLALEPGATLADSHARAARVEERIRRHCPQLAEIVVHTEPSE